MSEPRTLPGFSLPIVDAEDGPVLLVEGQLDWPLCVLVNAAVRGEIGDLYKRLKAGEEFTVGNLAVTKPPAAMDLTEQTTRFLADSGASAEDIEDMGGWIVMDGEPYPNRMIADVMFALIDERARWKRQNDLADGARAAWQRYRSYTSTTDPLFRCDAEPAAEPGPVAREMLVELEAAAQLVDTLDAELAEQWRTSAEDDAARRAAIELAAKISAKRRFLHVELVALGLLDDSAFDAKQRALAAWGCPQLAGYLQAGREFTAYMTSPERAKFALGLPVYPPSGGARLSIDWFRKPQPIPDKVVVGALEWAGWCERQADDYFTREGPPGTGAWLWHSGSVWHTFHWRYDDGVSPCLYRVT